MEKTKQLQTQSQYFPAEEKATSFFYKSLPAMYFLIILTKYLALITHTEVKETERGCDTLEILVEEKHDSRCSFCSLRKTKFKAKKAHTA